MAVTPTNQATANQPADRPTNQPTTDEHEGFSSVSYTFNNSLVWINICILYIIYYKYLVNERGNEEERKGNQQAYWALERTDGQKNKLTIFSPCWPGSVVGHRKPLAQVGIVGTGGTLHRGPNVLKKQIALKENTAGMTGCGIWRSMSGKEVKRMFQRSTVMAETLIAYKVKCK